jgi:hypothetical protein
VVGREERGARGETRGFQVGGRRGFLGTEDMLEGGILQERVLRKEGSPKIWRGSATEAYPRVVAEQKNFPRKSKSPK